MLDTIASIVTAPGESAVGIIRISGQDALNILNTIFVSKNKTDFFEPWKFNYGHIYNDSLLLDEVLTVYFKAPRSYTREDIVEIHCHGGYYSVRAILKLVLKCGARIAEPGEFTKRAFLNGRLDLVQAESVMDIINSYTESGNRVALNQLKGKLSVEISEIIDVLKNVRVSMAVSLDYPEEDIEEISYDEVREVVFNVKKKVSRLLSFSRTGKILRDGVNTVIVGKPNVGKSSILNALLREERAIVTDIPGTTRDVIEEVLNVRGIPVRIMDTAGIRNSTDIVEQFGIEKSFEAIEKAELIIAVFNCSSMLDSQDIKILELIRDKRIIVVLNKIDLNQQLKEEHLYDFLSTFEVVRTSATEGVGLTLLEDAIESSVLNETSSLEQLNISNMRHIQLLESIESHLTALQENILNQLPYEYLDIDFQMIVSELQEIIGESCTDDLIERIFSQFCLGK